VASDGGVTRGIAVDDFDNAIVTGWSGSYDGNNPFGKGDVFVGKFDSNGQKLWSRQIGSAEHEEPTSVAVDPTGSIYVAGYTEGDIDGGAVALISDTFIAKYGPLGNLIWVKQYRDLVKDLPAGSTYSFLFYLAFSDDGFLYAAGRTNGTVGGPNSGENDFLVAKLSTDGDIIWVSQFGTAGTEEAQGIDFLSTGDIVIVGNTYGEVPNEVSRGDRDCYVALVSNVDGALIWQTQFGSPGRDGLFGVKVNEQDEVFVTGVAASDTFEGKPLIGNSDGVIVKIDKDGNVR
jgi:hypothetical protein